MVSCVPHYSEPLTMISDDRRAMSVESRVHPARPEWIREDPARGEYPGVLPGEAEPRSAADVEPEEARPPGPITEVAPQDPSEGDPFRPDEPSEVITEVAPQDPEEDEPYPPNDPSEVITEVAPEVITEVAPEEPSEVITEVAPEVLPDEAE